MSHLGDEKSQAAADWHKKNAWFKASDLHKGLGALIVDATLDYATKSSALGAAVANGTTKSDVQAWRKSYGDKPDGKQGAIVKALDTAIAKAK